MYYVSLNPYNDRATTLAQARVKIEQDWYQTHIDYSKSF